MRSTTNKIAPNWDILATLERMQQRDHFESFKCKNISWPSINFILNSDSLIQLYKKLFDIHRVVMLLDNFIYIIFNR